MPGQGQRRGDLPTTIEQERRHALDIGMEAIKAKNSESLKKKSTLKTAANLPTEGP